MRNSPAVKDFNAPRLYVRDALPGPVAFDAGQTNYLRNVLRLGPGAEIRVFNGRDGEWAATVASLDRKGGRGSAGAKMRDQTPLPSLWFAFAPLKQARLDYMVEKATEMGAGRLVPVLTRHGQVRRINRERLSANIVEACEQCGIIAVPEIAEPVPLADFLGSLGDRRVVVADEALAGEPGDAVAAIRAAGPPLAVLVGPEGGFADEERTLFSPRAVRVSLGPRILRADTAAVALLALVEAAHPSPDQA